MRTLAIFVPLGSVFKIVIPTCHIHGQIIISANSETIVTLVLQYGMVPSENTYYFF